MTAFPTARRTALKPPEDVAGRLSSVTRNGAAFESYTFDANDNRLTKVTTAGTTTYAHDDQDRLLSAVGPSGAESWMYDANGDLTSRMDSSGTTSFEYDTSGQLLSVTRPNGDVVSYELDAGNKRAVKKINGVVQRKWLYAGGLLPVAEYDANDNLVAVFNGGYMVKNGTNYRLLRDHLGSVRLVVDAGTGDIVQRLSYGPWGEVLEDTNPGFQPFGYAGGLYDPDTGLVRFGARDYDPKAGRWTCKDPILLDDGLNAYQYAASDPINLLDRNGLVVETGWDAVNVFMGITSFTANVASGNIAGAAVDLAGLGYDSVATAIPGLPAGAGTAIKGYRLAKITFQVVDKIADCGRLLKLSVKARKNQDVARGLDALTEQLKRGNLNPGKGNKHIVGDIYEARHASGARVYFRNVEGGVEIVGESSKANQPEVINAIINRYGE